MIITCLCMSSLQHYIRVHLIVSISWQYDNHVSMYVISTTLHSSSPYSFYLFDNMIITCLCKRSLQHYIRVHHIVSISWQYDNHVSVYVISTTLIRVHHIVSISWQYDNHVSMYAISTTLHSSSPYSFYLLTIW